MSKPTPEAEKSSLPETSGSDTGPKIFTSKGSVTMGRSKVGYEAKAGWLPLRDKERVRADIFHTYYRSTEKHSGPRPITFVFNGGPGASSAFLHVGAIGPMRVDVNPDGTVPASPAKLVNNSECWLEFTDLVFVDPVGTGLSRTRPAEKKDGEAQPDTKDDPFYWNVQSDIDFLCDFITTFLTREKLWTAPIYLAGESYGGYRVGRLVRQLQEKAGVGISGAVLISPALEWDTLFAGDYNAFALTHLIPSMAAAARHHGRCDAAKQGEDLDAFLERAEMFAFGTALPGLSLGKLQPNDGHVKLLRALSDWLGLSKEVIELHQGKINFLTFTRELFRDERKVLGWYDAAILADDPFPASGDFKGVDMTLGGQDRIYTVGANTHIRENLGVESDLKYELLSHDVHQKWQWHDPKAGEPVPPGATDDLAVGISINKEMKVTIVHGIYDLVTPYFTSKYLALQLAASYPEAGKIELKNYEGGHMFYMWEASRKAFTKDMKAFYAKAG
ncbi:MAG: peptidase S10 [Alphaproteobacteria bacterium]|nr:MAG: peptidase S10 [Alphaproteobacteria bacterium]